MFYPPSPTPSKSTLHLYPPNSVCSNLKQKSSLICAVCQLLLTLPLGHGTLPQDTTLKKMLFISQQLPIDKNISITGGTLCHPSPLNTYTLCNAEILCSLSMCCFTCSFAKIVSSGIYTRH